ncbi:MAG TPA: hypothetical protein VER17_11745 [Tepidisphaeraceae bacterium]|nr:hypothetical protein [Tepidisphaeraceae bacterium]
MVSAPGTVARCIAVAGLALFAAALPAGAAPVLINAQDRSVHVVIPSIVDGEPAINETLTAPDNGPFNQTLDRTLNQSEQTNTALATQDSIFGETGDVFTANATGTTSYSATGLSGIVLSESDFSVTFTLAEARDYTLSGSGVFPDTGSGASNWSVTLTGPGGEVESFSKADFNPGNNDGAVVTSPFDSTGTLEAGQYTLTALSGVSGGTNSTQIASGFDVAFTATAVGGPPPTPIPLPPGVAPGAVMLLGMAAAYWAKQRQRLARA